MKQNNPFLPLAYSFPEIVTVSSQMLGQKHQTHALFFSFPTLCPCSMAHWAYWLSFLSPSGEGNGNPLQKSCLGNPIDRGACRAMVHRITKESDTTEETEHTHTQVIDDFIICSLTHFKWSISSHTHIHTYTCQKSLIFCYINREQREDK